MQSELRPGVLAVNNSRPVRGRNKTPEEMAYGLELLDQGMSIRTAAAKAGVNYRTLHVWSKRTGARARRVPVEWVQDAFMEACRLCGGDGSVFWKSSTASARIEGHAV